MMIKNKEQGKMLLENIETLNEAAVQLYRMLYNNNQSVDQFSDTMVQLLYCMQPQLDDLHEEEPALMAHLICKNTLYSLKNLMHHADNNKGYACHKIQFELIPLTNELYVDLYFWGFCYPDKEKMWHYYHNEMQDLCPLPIPKNREYKYDVSVVVIAYNKLEYTKLCISYLKKYFPKNINYELILYNNGSSDGTKEYFESLHPNKQIDLQNNTKSWSILSRVVEGKYVLTISNDILILPHAIENLLKCIESDESICCVAPTCPNIANLETISASYRNEEEMIEFAGKNNISDPYRWEQRARLNPPVLLGRSDSVAVNAFYTYLYPFSKERLLAFSDDLMGFIARRNKQKCILAKDAYVHHFGSVTVKSATHQNNKGELSFYTQGRTQFQKIFGIDPWGIGFCFDPELICSLDYKRSHPVNILGINCGMGDTPLKVKAMIKEISHNSHVKIYNITDNRSYQKDLDGLSDAFELISNWSQINTAFPGIQFTYLIAENVNPSLLSKRILKNLFSRVFSHGILAVKNNIISFQLEQCIEKKATKHWHIFLKK